MQIFLLYLYCYNEVTETKRTFTPETMITGTELIRRAIVKEMQENGKLAAIDARKKHFVKVAQELGFADDVQAFNALGKEFVAKARIGAPSTNITK